MKTRPGHEPAFTAAEMQEHPSQDSVSSRSHREARQGCPRPISVTGGPLPTSPPPMTLWDLALQSYTPGHRGCPQDPEMGQEHKWTCKHLVLLCLNKMESPGKDPEHPRSSRT